jgi:hypothetical protein
LHFGRWKRCRSYRGLYPEDVLQLEDKCESNHDLDDKVVANVSERVYNSLWIYMPEHKLL